MKRFGMTVFLVSLLAGLPPAGADGLQRAQWVGLTNDRRPAEWSARDVVFNRPPHDISSWKPTEAELRSTPRKSFISPLLRKEFSVKKEIESAIVSVCGLGLYELWINGSKVGDQVLAPAQTSYDERAFYNVFDVTQQIRRGGNAIGLMLGNGFYGQNVAFAPNLSYGAPRAKAELLIKHADGSTWSVLSDDSWRAMGGPVVFDNVYLGETFDARRLPPDWSSAGFNDSKWLPVEIMDAPGGRLEEQQLEPMRKVRKVEPVAVWPAEEGWIVDMGENMTGWLQIAVNEKKGTVVQMRFAEHLMPNRRNIDTASTGIHATGGEQKDIYICRGGGKKETWEPRFTYHGFRYVQITGLSSKPDAGDMTGWFVRTDVEKIGSFQCSDELINRFYEVSMRTIEGNLQGLLSDCPHRERCAWMGDMHAVGEAASYNFDLRKFWPKVARDIETMLGEGGGNEKAGLPNDPRAPCNIAVGKRNCGQARPDWGAATVLVPWYSYLYYGDMDLVKEAWPMMEGWMAYLNEFALKDGMVGDGYGDWCPPGSNAKMDTPPALTSTALYYQSLMAMQTMAKALDKPVEAAQYAEQAAVVKQAFNKRFYKTSDVPVEPVPEGTEIVIVKALYGSSSKQIDLTPKLRSLVASNKYTFKITNPFVGKDPAPGQKKKLELEYTVNGKLEKQTVNENSDVYFFRKSVAGYGSQTGNAVALFSGLVPDGKEQLVADGLASLIMGKEGGHYTTGIFGHRPLYTQLNDYGHGDVTRHLWRIIDWPSLGFMTEKHDLTTWPEVPYNWDTTRRYLRNSFNHPMHSGFAAAFHESLGGIRPDPETPGFKNIILKPCFLHDLEWAKASVQSPQGLISSHWKREGGQVIWQVVIPPDTTATVEFPNGRKSETIYGGSHEFSVKM
ncbi:hypothetical protein PDESU_01225 [Pontiella desulfatans]|uniref:alpha-L-rhamnosidase n=1 Tax=Pontiella desulfatans TaxID=2750659 RepID=A0A6C2TYE9_PONDE|nr:family 78 glycoside hydrolase catalytic domain [Pontiella desulfatans]VGO12672.1 hypothetical protein PDESU_01225 [Pontiella desulfatans]